MRPSVFAILVVALTTAYFVSPNDAQPTSEISPPTAQGVCQGSTMSFSCKTNGTSLLLYAPPIIDKSMAFNLFSFDPVQLCTAIRNVAATSILVDDGDNTTFTGTLTMFIPATQTAGNYTFFCNAIDAQTLDEFETNTTVIIEEPPASWTSNQSVCFILDTVANISWNRFGIANYVVTMNDKTYETTQNYVLVEITSSDRDRGCSYTVEAINSCGRRPTTTNPFSCTASASTKFCPDHPPTPDPPRCNIWCIIFIVIVIICITIIVVESICFAVCMKKEKDKNKQNQNSDCELDEKPRSD